MPRLSGDATMSAIVVYIPAFGGVLEAFCVAMLLNMNERRGVFLSLAINLPAKLLENLREED